MWADVLAGVNVALGLLIAGMQVVCFYRTRHGWRWIKLVIGLVGLYWAGLYLFVLLTPVGIYDSVKFGQVFVRPAFTLTLAMMASAAIARQKAGTC